MADYQEYGAEMEYRVSDKSKVVAGLLAIFLGSYGVDQFYLGKIGGGIASICITIGAILMSFPVGFVVGILALFTGGIASILAVPIGIVLGLLTMIWPIIRAIQAFTGKAKDGNGDPVLN
jgi:TM2 domain-containing membrane protein YozV